MNINAYDQPGVQDRKLAASGVNKLSVQIVEKLAALKGKTSGITPEIIKHLGINAMFFEAESILNDIYNNVDLPNSYPQLKGLKGLKGLKVTRKFSQQHMVFEFEFTK